MSDSDRDESGDDADETTGSPESSPASDRPRGTDTDEGSGSRSDRPRDTDADGRSDSGSDGGTDESRHPDRSSGADSTARTGSQRSDTDRGDTVSRAELEQLRARVEGFEADVEDRTLHRDEIERELEQYVRSRARRGHARGWGPYLVLGYGTAMTIAAFVFLGGLWAILAMLVIWLSTLGLYALMIIVGLADAAFELPGRMLDRLRSLRELR